MVYEKHESYTYALPLKNGVHWITKNIHFGKKCPKFKKKIIFSLMTTSHIL